MAGYEDTRKKIIETLMGRPNGEEIQPENHQDYALNMLNYIRSLELIANGPLIGIATPTTQPVQPDNARACYLAGVAQDRTVTFQNFRNYLGQPIQITNGEMEACLVILIWDTQYWSAETVPTSIISQADQANFYYNLTIRKTYSSVAAMNADSDNPIGTDGRLIKIGELVTVVNSASPAANGYYSYEGSENGWLLQSGFSFEVVQTTGTDVNKVMSQKAVSKELANVIAGLVPMDSVSNLAELETKPKRNNDAYYVEDQLNENGNPYIYRWDDSISQWVNTKQVTYIGNLARKEDANNNKILYTPEGQDQYILNRIQSLSKSALNTALTELELKILNILMSLDITGCDYELYLSLVIQDGKIKDLRLTNPTYDIFIVLTSNITYDIDNRAHAYISQHYNGQVISVNVLLNLNGVVDVVYHISPLNPNLKFISNSSIPVFANHKMNTLFQNGIINLSPERLKSPIVGNTIYYKFHISEPTILASVLVNVEELPLEDIAWIECGIYPEDDGFGTALRITSSNKQEVIKIGPMRLPLENKLLNPGNYAIGFKTNCKNSFSTISNVHSFRGWDTGNIMPVNALNLKYPFADLYGYFIGFSLVSCQNNIGIKYPHNWTVTYEPEYSFIGQNNEKTLNYYIRGEDDASGGKIRKFYASNDGGLTKNQMHSNNLDWEVYKQWGEPHTCVVTYGSNDVTIYYNTPKGHVIKCRIVGGVATLTDITPPQKSESASSYPVSSYAPLVLWKGYLWWGEYQDPKTPRIHKMNISTEQWSISVEKPTNGVNGARHCHFLYKSPVDPNVLWAVWGDASNGAGQGINRLEIKSGTASTELDDWIQWTTGLDDEIGTSLPYPTGIIETYKDGLICAGDQPPTHLIKCRTRGSSAGNYLLTPLTFKMETAPKTETCHWLTIDDLGTIYYMTVESKPYMSIYASPKPYTHSFRLSKYWQRALAGNIGYLNGYIQTRHYRFKQVEFINRIDSRNVSKTPYVPMANSDNLVDVVNKLRDNLIGSNILESSGERGNNKIDTPWDVDEGQFENYG